MSEITLPSGRRIGPGQPVFIIAEIGSNWTNLDDCLESIRQAKACGADAVKFQAYDFQSLYGMSVSYWGTDEGLRGTLDLNWLPKLKAESDKAGIEFMCSAFSPELARQVDPFVSIHKIASAEATHLRLLQATRSFGKPVFISTGAKGREDVKNALEVLQGVPTVLMYCVASYPANVIDLDTIPWMAREFGHLAGYSDHSTDALVIPSQAVFEGACVLEKHVTFIGDETPDSPHSLSGDDFRSMCNRLRGYKADQVLCTKAEKGMVLRHNRRLIATCDILPGSTLKEDENFGIFRSLKDDTHTYSPWAIDQVNGKRAVRAIKAGDGLGPGDVE